VADTYTPMLNLVQPEIGASRDTWGSKWNGNATILDQFVSMAMPIGAILDFAGPTPPSGWLVADGRLVSRTTYSALFAVIGTAWGTGDGSTTFALPPTAGRALVGPGNVIDTNGTALSFTYATIGGQFSNPILQANLPNITLTMDIQGGHTHGGQTVNAGTHTHTTDAQGQHSHGGQTLADGPDHTHSGYTDWQGNHAHNVSMNTYGGGSANGFVFEGNSQAGALSFVTDTQGQHYHSMTTGGASTRHYHSINGDGAHAHNVYAAGDHVHIINWDGNHAHTVLLGGSGTWLSLVQPLLVVTKIIYAGTQASTTTHASPPPATRSSETGTAGATEDELAAIREELAALRAILAPVRRVPRTPIRGPH
jgi:microcystin-dependent protein